MSFLTPRNHTDGAYTAVRIRADAAICKISAPVNADIFRNILPYLGIEAEEVEVDYSGEKTYTNP